MGQVIVQNDTLVKVVGVLADEPVKVIGINTAALNINTHINRGGTFMNPYGIFTAPAIGDVWRCVVACTVTNVRGLRQGGTGATVNARKLGGATHLASDLSLTSANTWIDGGAVQNTAYAVGDGLQIMLQSVNGAPTEVSIQLDFTT